MMKYVEKSGTGTHSVGYAYDSLNNLTALVETIGDEERKTSYTYDEDNRPTSVTNENSSRSYTYNDAGLLSQDVTKQNSTELFTRSFTYCNGATSAQVNKINYTGSNYSAYFDYTYDTRDLIGCVITDGSIVFYDYDDANQLIRESVIQNGNGKTTTRWTYDDAENILKREVYPYGQDSDPSAKISEVIYTYTDSDWGDLLTSYNGVPITYDGIGNPLNDGTWTYTWQHGRQLASMAKIDQSESWQFTYNADGLRTKRTNGTTTYNYTYLGGQLTHMTVDGHTMYFAYDASGVPLAMTYNGVTYYYVTNLQGDVVAILDSSGAEVVRYAYDAWGNPISTTGTLATTIGFYNPLRYRGYVYDEETKLYYLQSRYYDPEMGRFINGDNYPSTGQGLIGNNMFAYCGNNPVSRGDDGGEFWHIVAGAAIGAVVSFGASVIGDLVAGDEIDWAGAGISAAFGAVGGALAATGLGPVVQIAGGAALAGAENMVNQGRDKGFDNIDYNEVAINAVIGGISARSNGVSKSTAKHLHKQAAVATKRISNSVKHNTLKGIGKTIKSAGKYYLSQTKTLFYKPLINGVWDDFLSSVRGSVFEIPPLSAG